MLLLGQLAKIQGLKGEFLFHPVMDDPDRLEGVEGLVLAPPGWIWNTASLSPRPRSEAANLPLASGQALRGV